MGRPQILAASLLAGMLAAVPARADVDFTFNGPSNPLAPDGSGAYCNSVPLLLTYSAVSPDGTADFSSMNYSVSYVDGNGQTQTLAVDGAGGGGSGNANAGLVITSSTGALVGTVPLTLDSYNQNDNNAFLGGGTDDVTFETCSCDVPFQVSQPLALGAQPGSPTPLCASSQATFFWTYQPSCLTNSTYPEFTVSYSDSNGNNTVIPGLAVSDADSCGAAGGLFYFNMPDDVSGSVTLTFSALNQSDGTLLASFTETYPLADPGCSGGWGGSDDGCGGGPIGGNNNPSGPFAVCIPDGTLLFEDNWPKNGDLDFNDQTVSYNYQFVLDENYNLDQMLATFNVLSVGADTHNGVYLHLFDVPAAANVTIQLTDSNGNVSYPSPVAQETDLIIPIVEDTRSLFPGVQSRFINTDPSVPAVAGTAIAVLITFNDPTDGSGDSVVDGALFSGAPLDVFIAQTGNYGHQIHLPQYPGTDLADPTLFGSFDDGSSNGDWYVNQLGLPFALDVPTDIAWPQETISIDRVYPDLVSFAQSGSPDDWYESTVVLDQAFTSGANNTTPPAPNLFMPPLEGIYGACTPNSFGGGASLRSPGHKQH